MADIMKAIEVPEVSDPDLADRKINYGKLDDQAVQRRASDEALELTEEHWEVMERLRESFVANGPEQTAKDLDAMLGRAFDDRGGRKYLHALFPQGPVAQGMRLAGLPVPPDAVDKSYGSAL
jgi:TusE/DsrC/DsvC family sulfur relay protein